MSSGIIPGQPALAHLLRAVAVVHCLAGAGSFLHTHGQDMAWYEVVLIDVLAVYAAALALVILLLVQGHKFPRMLSCKRDPSKRKAPAETAASSNQAKKDQ